MVMKRVEAGDDSFAEYYMELLPSSNYHEIGVPEVKAKESPSSGGRTSEMYEGLSQMDQQAVQILYQMAHWVTYFQRVHIIM